MAKKKSSKKKKPSPIKKLKKLLSKLLLVATVLGGYYVYKNPSVVPADVPLISQEQSSQSAPITLDNFVGQEKVSEILGKTTSIVEEGLENIKVPKKITGTDEEIVIEDAVDQLMQKIKDLPEDQIDRIKIQLAKDLLESVDGAMVTVEE